jgi:hypothetical protein
MFRFITLVFVVRGFGEHQDQASTTTSTTALAAKTDRLMPAAKRRRASEKTDAAPTDNANTSNSTGNTKLASVASASLLGPTSFATSYDKELKSLKMSFSIAQAESQVLRQEKRELEEQLEETETMREQNQDIIDRVRRRMQEMQAELQLLARILQPDWELEAANKNSVSAGLDGVTIQDDYVPGLEPKLDASRAQVTKLERSKNEPIDNYEKHLRDEDDDNDDSGSDNDKEGSEGEKEASPKPKKDTRQRTRRQIQPSEVALPPSRAKAKAKRPTRASNRRPAGSVSSNALG